MKPQLILDSQGQLLLFYLNVLPSFYLSCSEPFIMQPEEDGKALGVGRHQGSLSASGLAYVVLHLRITSYNAQTSLGADTRT